MRSFKSAPLHVPASSRYQRYACRSEWSSPTTVTSPIGPDSLIRKARDSALAGSPITPMLSGVDAAVSNMLLAIHKMLWRSAQIRQCGLHH